MRTGLRRSACVATVAVLVAMGLFVMHVLASTEHGAGSHAHASAHVPTMSLHSLEMGGSALVDAAHTSMNDHMHDLLACLALLATAVACIVSLRATRLRPVFERIPDTMWWTTRASQRAPPVSVRLALVGISRR